MLNTYTLNTIPLNNYLISAGEDVVTGLIIFNNFSLQSSDVITSILRKDSMPLREFERQDVPRSDGRFSVGDFMREKIIKMRGTLKKTTAALLDAEIDSMKKVLSKREKNLDITDANDVVKRFVATLINGDQMFERRASGDITKVPFDLEFACLDPYGKSINYVGKTFLDDTRLEVNELINNTGTARSLPVVILNFSAEDNITAISFKNNTRNEEIKITQNILATDYIKFDSENQEVTTNGNITDYEGIFPDFDTDNNSLAITLTGTSATYDLTIKYKISYL